MHQIPFRKWLHALVLACVGLSACGDAHDDDREVGTDAGTQRSESCAKLLAAYRVSTGWMPCDAATAPNCRPLNPCSPEPHVECLEGYWQSSGSSEECSDSADGHQIMWPATEDDAGSDEDGG